MRKMLVLCAALLAITAPRVDARAHYVGLFCDGVHSVCQVVYVPPFRQFELWIWWYPAEDGLVATMHELVFPSNVVSLSVTAHPDCTVALGCECGPADPAYCCVRAGCATGWTWTHHIDCFLMDASPGWIDVVPCGDQPLVAASCAPGYPVGEVIILNNFALNQPCVVAVESRSWGAIKGLYR